MNRINPVYILLLFAVLCFSSFSVIKKKEEQLSLSTKRLNEYKSLATTYNILKKEWGKKEEIEKTINKILKSNFRDANIIQEQNSKYIKIKFISENSKLLSKFTNKLLNHKLIINKIEILKNSVTVEIRL